MAGGARILLARPDHLGDVLLTLPAAAALRRALPDARISYLVAPAVADVPRHCPAVDETLVAPFPPPTAPPDPPGWAEVVRQRAPALRGRFDVAVLPRPNDPWSGALVAAAGIPVRVGYAYPTMRRFLTAALPVPACRHAASMALDVAAVALRSLGAPGVLETGRPGERLFVPAAAEEAEALALVPAAEPAPFVLHPGSAWPVKNWPAHRWGRLAAALRGRYGVAPLVVGGPSERALVEEVVEASGRSARGVPGRLSLGGLAALQRRARLVFGTDSGPLHLAALVGAPVVGLYGPACALHFAPWCPPDRRRAVHVQLPCSPCGILEDPPCGASIEPACIMGITVEAVLAAAAELLGERASGPSVARA